MLVDERSADAVAASIRESDRLGLLSRPDRESPHRFHPLVRDFLVARLTAEIGEAAVRELHRHVAEELRPSRWFAAAWHYREAGKPASAGEVVDSSVSSVLAAGQLEQTRQFLDGSAGSINRTGALILRSRLEVERGNLTRAIDLAQEASEQAHGTDKAGLALLNLTAVLARHGFNDRSVELASQALGGTLSPAERQVAEATVVVSSTQDEGDLAAVADYLAGLALVQDAAGHARYAGITRLNLAGILLWQGRPREASEVACTSGGRSGAFAGEPRVGGSHDGSGSSAHPTRPRAGTRPSRRTGRASHHADRPCRGGSRGCEAPRRLRLRRRC